MISHKNLDFQFPLKTQRQSRLDAPSIRQLKPRAGHGPPQRAVWAAELGTVRHTLCWRWQSLLLIICDSWAFFFYKQTSLPVSFFAKNNRTKDELRKPSVSRKMRALIYYADKIQLCWKITLNQLPSWTPPLREEPSKDMWILIPPAQSLETTPVLLSQLF